MTTQLRPSSEELARGVADATAGLGPAEWLLAGTLFRLLADGEPVEVERLTDASHREPSEVASALRELPEVFLDDRERLVGVLGLTIEETPHLLRLDDDRRLYGWCAWDALYIPPVLGRSARVESRCPTTGEPVALRVTPEGVDDVSPPGVVLSALLPEQPFDPDVIASFCDFVHFFASEAAATEWTAKHDGTFTLSVAEGFELGLLYTARLREALR
jgi:alkylmercury lyase